MLPIIRIVVATKIIIVNVKVVVTIIIIIIGFGGKVAKDYVMEPKGTVLPIV